MEFALCFRLSLYIYVLCFVHNWLFAFLYVSMLLCLSLFLCFCVSFCLSVFPCVAVCCCVFFVQGCGRSWLKMEPGSRRR
ncbi:hypothetical protein EDC01DRAFT_681423 [Geopyxis carbonaria]|nr:hypothetical protein EDC01DRAFT_681423 [Geopyxis carbonaria]